MIRCLWFIRGHQRVFHEREPGEQCLRPRGDRASAAGRWCAHNARRPRKLRRESPPPVTSHKRWLAPPLQAPRLLSVSAYLTAGAASASTGVAVHDCAPSPFILVDWGHLTANTPPADAAAEERPPPNELLDPDHPLHLPAAGKMHPSLRWSSNLQAWLVCWVKYLPQAKSFAPTHLLLTNLAFGMFGL